METKEKVLEELTKEELIELIKQLQKEREHWKHRFQCVDKEYDVVCWKYHIPRYWGGEKMEKFYSRKELGELSVDELINLIMYLQDKLEILEHDLKDTRRQLEDATEDNKNLYEALVQVQKIVRPF